MCNVIQHNVLLCTALFRSVYRTSVAIHMTESLKRTLRTAITYGSTVDHTISLAVVSIVLRINIMLTAIHKPYGRTGNTLSLGEHPGRT